MYKTSCLNIPCERRLHFRGMSWRAKSSQLQPRSVLGSNEVMQMSCKVNFHVVNQLCRFQCMDLKIIRIQIYSPGLKAKRSFIFMIIHSLLKQNINHASGEGNENDKKKKDQFFFFVSEYCFLGQERRRQDFSEFSKSPQFPSTFQTSFRCSDYKLFLTDKRPSIKPGTWNIPEHAGTSRNIPEHPGTSRNMKKILKF